MTFLDVANQAVTLGGADVIDEHGNIISVLKSGECVYKDGLDTCGGTEWRILKRDFSFKQALTLISQGKRVTFVRSGSVLVLPTYVSCTFEKDLEHPGVKEVDIASLHGEKFYMIEGGENASN